MSEIENNMTVPAPIYFGEENEVLDFEQIQQMADEAMKKAIIDRKVLPKTKIELTVEEQKKVDNWVKDLEKHIKDFAKTGSKIFTYKCDKLPTHLFYEIALSFKEKNPRFYVETHGGTQEIKVTWDGKNEV